MALAMCPGCHRLFGSLWKKWQTATEVMGGRLDSCDTVYLPKCNLLPWPPPLLSYRQPTGTSTRKETVECLCFLLSPICHGPSPFQTTWPISKLTIHPSLFGTVSFCSWWPGIIIKSQPITVTNVPAWSMNYMATPLIRHMMAPQSQPDYLHMWVERKTWHYHKNRKKIWDKFVHL